ncbi:GntR family transcriptional regulator [Zavarzinia compransoris]|uniref:GntR family transcriptional regulator n=1 Tax=Zavarzinia marina TaxID=2911065 RepID=UPI001F1F5F8C|nr:GntR family transcriptional regulator [Zavarzinia marina]MCF4167313.1 GntR family transcriptional regulator [Zavarzinia marina]
MPKTPSFALDGQGPLFKQIGRAVTEQILKGRYKQGEKLPSEAELTEIFNTSRQTVNKAITELAKSGLVERNRRAGTVVSWQFQERFVLPLRDVSDEIERTKQLYEYRILERRVIRNGKGGVTWPALPAGARLLFIEAIHLADNLPVQLETRYINFDAFPHVEHEQFQDVPPSKWLLDNIPWSEVEHTVRATNASADLANKLGVKVGAALLVVDRQTFHRGLPITVVHLTYPGDRFSIKGRFSLDRPES